MLILNKIFSVVSQRQDTHYLPSPTYYGTYIPCSPYTHPVYHDTAHDTLLTQMCDQLTNSDNPLAFLSVHHWKLPNFTFQTSSSISGSVGSHALCAVSKVFANLV
jgi:hypothetical protein